MWRQRAPFAIPSMTMLRKETMMAARRTRRGWMDVDKSDIRVSELVRNYLMHQEDRNHSPETVRWYRDMLGRFAASLGPDARLLDPPRRSRRAAACRSACNDAFTEI
jgi:hypothetical protein